MAITNNDQNILDVVTNVTRDLRHSREFCEQLEKLDDETVRKVAKSYIEWLYKALESETKKDEDH